MLASNSTVDDSSVMCAYGFEKHRGPFWLVAAACLAGMLATPAVGAGGPENVFLVVNRRSSDSLTIANHYCRLRQIPAGNVLCLSWPPKTQKTSVKTFREQILSPVLAAIRNRRLSRQIDYIIYSCDFPWGIDLQEDLSKFFAKLPDSDGTAAVKGTNQRALQRLFTPVGSINGLTYLWEPVSSGSPGYLELRANRYMRIGGGQQEAATLGFKSSWQFGPDGKRVESGGRRYMLSMMLGVTAGRGNTVREVLNYLRRSAAADGTYPGGTIYFAKNSGIRSKARDKLFPLAVKMIQRVGVKAEIINGTLPTDKKDVQGLMTGTSRFDWNASGSRILPGAICEHFTSWGGVMDGRRGQTALSEFLRYGAAGASGTVTEPYSIPAKFPLASIHIHYTRGCTLAEAFYQSVYCPYQLLIVGDPLCRPWARIPAVKVEGVLSDDKVKGKLALKPSTASLTIRVERFDLFVDGWLRKSCKPGESIEWDTTRLADGYHELRVVAVEKGLIRSQGRKIIPITTENHGRTITASIAPQGDLEPGKPFLVKAESPGSVGIVVLHQSRMVGKITGHSGQVAVDPVALGNGPARLHVVGIGDGGPVTYVSAEPFNLTVKPK